MAPNPGKKMESQKPIQKTESQEPVVYGPKPAEPTPAKKDSKVNEKKQTKEHIEKMQVLQKQKQELNMELARLQKVEQKKGTTFTQDLSQDLDFNLLDNQQFHQTILKNFEQQKALFNEKMG